MPKNPYFELSDKIKSNPNYSLTSKDQEVLQKAKSEYDILGKLLEIAKQVKDKKIIPFGISPFLAFRDFYAARNIFIHNAKVRCIPVQSSILTQRCASKTCLSSKRRHLFSRPSRKHLENLFCDATRMDRKRIAPSFWRVPEFCRGFVKLRLCKLSADS